MRIYVDNAAATKLDERVPRGMPAYPTENFGNPSGIYAGGRDAKRAAETARGKAANYYETHGMDASAISVCGGCCSLCGIEHMPFGG